MTRRVLAAGLFALALCGALCGCVSVLPKSKPVQLYRFGGGEPAAAATPQANAPAVALGAVTLPRAAAGDGLLTVTGDQAAFVGGARWVSPAAILMREAAVRAFAGQSSVRLVGDGGPAAARLELAVTTFEARYAAPGAPPVVQVVLTATLTPRTGAALVRNVAVARPAAANRLAAIVPAYDAATRDALGQVAAWTVAQAATLRPAMASGG